MHRWYASIVSLALCGGCAQPKTGLLIMAHGGDSEWDQEVKTTVAPLQTEYPTEIAFGMAVPSSLETAAQKLEARGVERIVVVRMFVSGDSFLEATEYILGQRERPPAGGHEQHSAHDQKESNHDHAHHEPESILTAAGTAGGTKGTSKAEEHSHHHMEPPRRIRANAKFVLSRQGVAESPLIDQILVDRARSLSNDPSKESVLILGHGPGDDAENQRWLAAMQQRAQRLREIGEFRNIRCETLREDWPDKRAEAEKRIRQFVNDGNKNGGRVIVVPFRVAGFGPYKEVLADLDYVADGRGFCPHPNMTRWLNETAKEMITRNQ